MGTLVVRTQVQLTEAQARALRKVAAREGVSMAEVIRRAASDRRGRAAA